MIESFFVWLLGPYLCVIIIALLFMFLIDFLMKKHNSDFIKFEAEVDRIRKDRNANK